MTREEALAFYHPIRESVRRILGAAISACDLSDLIRAAKQLGLWGDGKISLPEGEQAAEMLSDIALFEPNQRGPRAFDVFLAAKARQLDPADFELAQRMGKAFFSLFRCTARHGMAGVWLEDRLDRNRSDAAPITSARTAYGFPSSDRLTRRRCREARLATFAQAPPFPAPVGAKCGVYQSGEKLESAWTTRSRARPS
jgi:hypothetical protein